MPTETLPVTTHTEGLAAMNAVLRYVEQQAKLMSNETMLLY